MIDAVLTHPHKPEACGVAKFSHALAKRLGVPCVGDLSHDCDHPLISIKGSEYQLGHGARVDSFDLFAHDSGWFVRLLSYSARHVYAGSRTIADALREVRPDVIEAFCPSTIEGNPTRGAYRVLVFGMAHKLNLPHFEALKARLDVEHPDYTIELSTAVHEGHNWAAAFTESERSMRAIFGDKLRVLGFLGDDALALLLGEVHAVAAYYVPALRANNTTYWAAVGAGRTVYTNRDEFSPQEGDPPASWDRLIEMLQ